MNFECRRGTNFIIFVSTQASSESEQPAAPPAKKPKITTVQKEVLPGSAAGLNTQLVLGVGNSLTLYVSWSLHLQPAPSRQKKKPSYKEPESGDDASSSEETAPKKPPPPKGKGKGAAPPNKKKKATPPSSGENDSDLAVDYDSEVTGPTVVAWSPPPKR